MLKDRYCQGKKSCLTVRGSKTVIVRIQPTLFNSARRPSLCPLNQHAPLLEVETGPKNPADPKKEDLNDEAIDEAEAPLFVSSQHKSIRTRPDLSLPNLAPLASAYKTDGFHSLFLDKVSLCCSICDFDNEEMDLEAKRVKEFTLKEILACYDNRQVFTSLRNEHHTAVLDMCERNVFRTLHSIPDSLLIYDKLPPMQDRQMQHLSLVYGLMKRLIGPKVDVTIRPRLGIDLCKNLECPDMSEREMVSDILFAYYQIRPEERKSLLTTIAGHMNIYRSDCSHVPPFCVWPSLKILAKIYKSAAPQISDDMLIYFLGYVVPLLTSQHFPSFVPMFKAVCDVVVASGCHMARSLMRYCLFQFPLMAANKQVCVFELMNELMGKLTPSDFTDLCGPIFRRYAEGAESGNAKVAEMSLRIWSDSHTLPLIFDNSKLIFPIFFHSIVACSREHWNSKVRARAVAVLKIMRDVNLNLFDDMCSCEGPCVRNKQKMWASIARSAAKLDRDVDLGRTLASIQIRFNPPIVQKPPSRPVTASARTEGPVGSAPLAGRRAVIISPPRKYSVV